MITCVRGEKQNCKKIPLSQLANSPNIATYTVANVEKFGFSTMLICYIFIMANLVTFVLCLAINFDKYLLYEQS